MNMLSLLTCTAEGHAFREITHEGSAYRYCLKCGKTVWSHRHIVNRRVKPEAGAFRPQGRPAASTADATAEELCRFAPTGLAG